MTVGAVNHINIFLTYSLISMQHLIAVFLALFMRACIGLGCPKSFGAGTPRALNWSAWMTPWKHAPPRVL